MAECSSDRPSAASHREKDSPDDLTSSVDPKTAAEQIDEGWAAQVIDVRTYEERAATGWIADSLQIPLAEFGARAGDEIDPARPVLVYCQNGTRSAFAVDALLTSGYEALDLSGGLSAWTEAGLPVETG